MKPGVATDWPRDQFVTNAGLSLELLAELQKVDGWRER